IGEDGMRGMPLRRLGPLINRGDREPAHERSHMLAADAHALVIEQITQHAAAGERQLEMQFVNAPHQRERLLAHRVGAVVHRRAGQPQKARLACDREPVRPVDHRFPVGPGPRPSALAKKSNSSACCPILAWSAFTSIGGSRRSPSPKASAACATSWRRHSVIWLGCTSKRCASSASVALLSIAAKATFALNAGEWLRRGRRIGIEPPGWREYRLVERQIPLIRPAQILQATSSCVQIGIPERLEPPGIDTLERNFNLCE